LLSAAEGDQIRLSFCLAIATAVARQGVRLPLLLDEPFLNVKQPRDTAAFAAVLDAFARQGNQVIVFTGEPEGIERLSSLGARVYDLVELRRWRGQNSSAIATPITTAAEETASIPPADEFAHAADQRRVRPVAQRRRTTTDRSGTDRADEGEPTTTNQVRRKVGRKRAPNGKASGDGSDAA
jgi:hypothetical protein